MNEKLNQLKEILAEVSDLSAVIELLGWDKQVNMPLGGGEARAQQLATLEKIMHQKFTDEKVGYLLDDLKKEFDGADTNDAALIRVAARDYDKATRLPSDFIAELVAATANSYTAWVEARAKSDFSIFRPHLEKILDLVKRKISFFPSADHPYDVLLDDFEPGMKTAEVRAIFNMLRPKQVELIKAIASTKQPDVSFLKKKYSDQKLWDFGVQIITAFGYDWGRGRKDLAQHPFESSFSANDVRITTRYEHHTPPTMLFTAMHEAGHALYEQGSHPSFERTPLRGGVSSALHESQSRMWENLVGRSFAFWEHFYPQLKKTFPSQLEGVSLQKFYKGINKVEPSFIRVNADEATYNLHIMLRFELEIDMIEGKAAIEDLPEIWNTKMKDYLGITPPNDAQGVLQDIHWADGLMGYFSTYALGNLVSAQLWETINKEIRDLDDQIRRGDFSELLNWLRKNIHVHGKKYEPQTLIEKVTGSKITPEPYIRYLTKKYGQIYRL